MKKTLLLSLLLAACTHTAAPGTISASAGGTTPAADADRQLYKALDAAFGTEDCSLGGHCAIEIFDLTCDREAHTCSAPNPWFESDAPESGDETLTANGDQAAALADRIAAFDPARCSDTTCTLAQIVCLRDWDKNLETGGPDDEQLMQYACDENPPSDDGSI